MIKVRQYDHGIFERIRDVRIFDHLHSLPVFNDQHVGWTAADKESVFCKLDWISSSFVDELDGLVFDVVRLKSFLAFSEASSHDPVRVAEVVL